MWAGGRFQAPHASAHVALDRPPSGQARAAVGGGRSEAGRCGSPGYERRSRTQGIGAPGGRWRTSALLLPTTPSQRWPTVRQVTARRSVASARGGRVDRRAPPCGAFGGAFRTVGRRAPVGRRGTPPAGRCERTRGGAARAWTEPHERPAASRGGRRRPRPPPSGGRATGTTRPARWRGTAAGPVRPPGRGRPWSSRAADAARPPAGAARPRPRPAPPGPGPGPALSRPAGSGAWRAPPG